MRPFARDYACAGQVGDLLLDRHISQVKGTQKIADTGGLTVSNPGSEGAVPGVVAIAGLPPLSVFNGEHVVRLKEPVGYAHKGIANL